MWGLVGKGGSYVVKKSREFGVVGGGGLGGGGGIVSCGVWSRRYYYRS